MDHLVPKDRLGRTLEVGDWVRLVEIPAGVSGDHPETYAVFQAALGKTFRIESFDDYGHAELDVSRKVAKNNWIWVEPEAVLRFRRRRKP